MRRLPALLACLLASPAWAGDLVGYVAGNQASIDTFDRWPDGIASPARNPSGSFVGAGIDLSGIGWRTDAPTFAVSLISPQYIVGAAHVGFGSTVTFADNGGQVHTYALATNPDGSVQTRQLTTPGQGTSDVLVARLAAPVSAADGVRFLRFADVNATTAVGLEAFAYTQNTAYGSTGPNGTGDPTRRQLGLATISQVGTVAFGTAENPTSPTTGAVWRQDANRTGSVLLTGGDSGGPLFARGYDAQGVGSEAALIGCHFGVDEKSPTSVSSFLPDADTVGGYVAQMNDFMSQDGYQVLFVPVPEPAGLLAVAVVGALAWRRGFRARSASEGRYRV